MTVIRVLDRIAQRACAEQTGVRFQYSRISLQANESVACKPHSQIVIMEVCKSLGSEL